MMGVLMNGTVEEATKTISVEAIWSSFGILIEWRWHIIGPQSWLEGVQVFIGRMVHICRGSGGMMHGNSWLALLLLKSITGYINQVTLIGISHHGATWSSSWFAHHDVSLWPMIREVEVTELLEAILDDYICRVCEILDCWHFVISFIIILLILGRYCINLFIHSLN